MREKQYPQYALEEMKQSSKQTPCKARKQGKIERCAEYGKDKHVYAQSPVSRPEAEKQKKESGADAEK